MTVVSNVSGKTMQRDPAWTASMGLNYETELAAGTLRADTNLYFNSGFYWTADDAFRQPTYTLLNASVAYVLPHTNVELRAWGANITDRRYEVQFYPFAFGALTTDAMPRTYGVTASVKF